MKGLLLPHTPLTVARSLRMFHIYFSLHVIFSKGRQVIISDSNFDIDREESDFQVNAMHFLETVKAKSTSFPELHPNFKFVAFPKRHSCGVRGI